VFSYYQDGRLITQAGVPAAVPRTKAYFFAEIDFPRLDTGIAIANHGDLAARVRLELRPADFGASYGLDLPVMPARTQRASFISQLISALPKPYRGTCIITSDAPVVMIALRQTINERNEVLYTTLPVGYPGMNSGATSLHFPHFADGGGFTTQIFLTNVNPNPISGAIRVYDPEGRPLALSFRGVIGSSFLYRLNPQESLLGETIGAGDLRTGSLVVESSSSPLPSGVAIFRYRHAGTLVSEAAVLPNIGSRRARLFVDITGSRNTGIAVRNASANDALQLSVSLRGADGISTGRIATITIPPQGQIARFIDQVFPGLS
jgi:hypothetical protein